MYADPTHIRKHEIKIRVNQERFAAIDALARLNKMQRAVFAMELMDEALAAREQRMRERSAIGSR